MPLSALPSYLHFLLIISLTIILLDAFRTAIADADPLTDISPDATTFTLHNIFSNGDVSVGPGGTRAALNTSIFPALQSQGITIVRFEMVPCGINPPHTHPRATEMLTLIKGGPLQAGFIDTQGVPHIEILYAGDVTIFPRGMLHFELNVGNETAHYLSALNSQNPGTLTAVESLLQVPARALASAFNQRVADVLGLKSLVHDSNHKPRLEKSDMSGCVPGNHIAVDF